MAKHQFPISTTGAVDVIREGPVTLRIRETTPTHGILELAVDYEKAQPPDKAYAADYCRVQKVDYDYVLIFGKLIPGKAKLRNKVEMSFSHKAFAYQLWHNSRGLHKSLAEELQVGRRLPLDVEDTDTVQSFRANNVFSAWLGEDGLIDFYYIPPSDIHYARAGKRSRISLDPILRIVMSSHILLSCLEQVDDLVRSDSSFASTIEKDMNSLL